MNIFQFLKAGFVLVFFALIAFSCKQTQYYQSVAESKMQTEIQYIGYDGQSGIRYAVSNDNDYLYIRLEALSKPSVIKIMQAGFFIYVDTIGKKSKDIWFNYPVGENEQQFNSKLFRQGEVENAAMVGKINLEAQIKDVAEYAIFSSNKEQEDVKNSKADGFAYGLKPGDYGSLSYFAAISLNRIKKAGIENIDQLTIGIVSGAFERPSMPAGGGGGRGRGMNGVPSTQTQQNIDPQRMREMALMSQPINFWIPVKLHKN
ncbi:MAG: hypothetical protein JW729_08200 [Bacteroidales bacterium]|nr:hypothetical protein [Bacteroidales bacterium]